jgi:putative flippase GtrA
MILTNPKERARFMRFSMVGAIGAVVDFGTFNLLTSLVKINPVISSMLSFTAAVSSNFTWNRFWTYPDSRSKRLTHQVGQFILVSLTGLAIRTPIFAILERILVKTFASLTTSLPLTPEILGHNLALAIAVGVVMLWNFFVNRYWTYNDVDKKGHDQ